MPTARRFRSNSPPIIQETIDQETIMVNLDTGTYYSLSPVGSYIWMGLEDGADVESLGLELAQRFEIEPTAAATDAQAFVDLLIEEELIVPAEGDGPAKARRDCTLSLPTYDAPSLARYTDMQDLLLLDPVHEVDPSGWPARR